MPLVTFRVGKTLLLLILLVGMAGTAGCRKKPAESGASTPRQEATHQPTRQDPDSLTAIVVAKVGDSPITKNELDRELLRVRREHDVTKMEQGKLKHRALQRLIDRHLVLAAASRDGIEVTSREVRARIDQEQKRRGGEELFAGWLSRRGWSLEEYEDEIRYQILLDKLIDKYHPVAISEEDLKAYYQKIAESPARGEKAHVHRILIKVPKGASPEEWTAAEEKILAIRKEIEAGLPFAEAARKYSQGGFAKRGGDMGIAGRNRLPLEVFAPAFTMAVGEMKGPMRVSEGVQLLLVTERFTDKVGSFEEERTKIQGIVEKRTRYLNARKVLRDLREQFPVVERVM